MLIYCAFVRYRDAFAAQQTRKRDLLEREVERLKTAQHGWKDVEEVPLEKAERFGHLDQPVDLFLELIEKLIREKKELEAIVAKKHKQSTTDDIN